VSDARAILNRYTIPEIPEMGFAAVEHAAAEAVAPRFDPYAEVVKLLVAAGAVE